MTVLISGYVALGRDWLRRRGSTEPLTQRRKPRAAPGAASQSRA